MKNIKNSKIDILIFIPVFAQCLLSLIFPIYQDKGWVKYTWFGNDLVTLFAFLPLFAYSLTSKSRIRYILRYGCYGYLIYNYAFYLLGTEINKLFIVYALVLILSVIGLINYTILESKLMLIEEYFSMNKKNIFSAAIFLFIGTGLGSVWIGTWISYSFFNGKLPIDSSIFRLVASLDLTMIVVPFIISGIMLLQKKRTGFVIGSIVSIQGFLYLLVLTFNSILFSAKKGIISGELPIWGVLLLIEFSGVLAFFIYGRKTERER